MGTLFSFSIMSSIAMAAMYLAYKWMLAGEKQHRYNRAMIWIAYFMSLALPLALHAWQLMDTSSEPDLTATQDISIGLTAIMAAPTPPLLPRLLLGIYITGISVVFLHTVVVAVKLAKTITTGEKHAIGRYNLVITPDNRIAPFSYMRYIVMSREDYASAGDMIIRHEMCHLRSQHWIDLLVAQVVAILQWYNPAAWLMREEFKTVHEYQADEAVLASGAEPRQYQMLLIKKAVGTRFPSLANSLNHSKLKKRITMMYKTKSPMARRMRALALIPAAALAIYIAEIPAVASALSQASNAELAVTDNKVTENPQEQQLQQTLNDIIASVDIENNDASDIEYYVNGERMSKEFVDALAPSSIANINIDKSADGKARMDITLKDDETGNSTDTHIYKASYTGGDMEIYVNGVPVSKAELNVISADSIQSIIINKRDSSIQVITKSAPDRDHLPEFPGGDVALQKYVSDNIRMPEAVTKGQIEGKVAVQFTIYKTGKVGNATVLKSVHPDLDAEALRVVGSLPDFIPGTKDGQPVDISYVIPITFKAS